MRKLYIKYKRMVEELFAPLAKSTIFGTPPQIIDHPNSSFLHRTTIDFFLQKIVLNQMAATERAALAAAPEDPAKATQTC